MTEQILIQDVVGLTVSDDPAVCHQHDFIGERCGKIEIVNDKHDSSPFERLLFNNCEHIALMLQIEACSRFIEKERGRFGFDARSRGQLA